MIETLRGSDDIMISLLALPRNARSACYQRSFGSLVGVGVFTTHPCCLFVVEIAERNAAANGQDDEKNVFESTW